MPVEARSQNSDRSSVSVASDGPGSPPPETLPLHDASHEVDDSDAGSRLLLSGDGSAHESRTIVRSGFLAKLGGGRTATGFATLAGAIVAVFATLAVVRARRARGYAGAWSALEGARGECDALLGLRRWLGGKALGGFCAEESDGAWMGRGFGNGAAVRFLVLGDWGRDGFCCQRDVARGMARAAEDLKPAFVANVGDSFYPRGLADARDPQVETSWRAVYGVHAALSSLVWRSVAGNHDYYRGSVESQLQLSNAEPLWHFPAPWYFQEEDNGRVLLAFLDTTPLAYAPDEMDRLDPWLREHPGARAEARRRRTRDARVQVDALKARLLGSSAAVKLVLGHHPLYSHGEAAANAAAMHARMRDALEDVMVEGNVTAYLCGHEHAMEHSVARGVHHFVVGSGSKVTKVSSWGEESVFALGRQGFAAVAVSESSVRVQFEDLFGRIVHSVSVPPRGAETEA